MTKDDEGGPPPSLGLLSLAGAVLSNPLSDAGAIALAKAVLGRVALEAESKADLHAPREAESIAAQWNRHMDAALDAANESSAKRSRATRRVMMAQALDAADLMLLERRVVAALLAGEVEVDADETAE